MSAGSFKIELYWPGGDRLVAPPLFVLPNCFVPLGEVSVRRRSREVLQLELRPPTSPVASVSSFGGIEVDVPVGRLPVLSSDAHTGASKVSFLELPPPPPFTFESVTVMWNEVRDAGGTFSEPLRRQALWHGAGGGLADVQQDIGLTDLMDVVTQSRSLLARPPLQDARGVVWRSPDLPGGREDMRLTERYCRDWASQHGRRRVPLSSARVVPGTSRWTIASLSWLLLQLAEAAEELLDSESMSGTLLTPIRLLGLELAPGASQLDRPVPSWPKEYQRLRDAVLRALLSALPGRGRDRSAPLARFWRLYEAWIGVQLLRELTDRLGQVPDTSGEPTDASIGTSARWETSSRTTCVFSKVEIGRSPVELLQAPRVQIRSITSKLIPDYLVVDYSDRGCSVHVVDAKYRSSSPDRGDMAAEASKYHWGLEIEVDGVSQRLTEVVIAAPERVSMFDEPSSRIRVERRLPATQEHDARVSRGPLVNL